MKKKYLIILISVLLFSCRKDSSLDRTIFIPDDDDENLPAYSEWGYNSFGAKYGSKDYFIVSHREEPCRVAYINSTEQFVFSLYGRTNNDWKKMEISIFFPFQKISKLTDLEKLHKKKFDLSDCTVIRVIEEKDLDTLKVSEGELHFKRVQILNVDEKLNRVILSGTFNLRFQMLSGVHDVSLSDGRFDVGITEQLLTINK